MIITFFNIITILTCLYILKNFKNGFFISLCSQICIPGMVRLHIGNININIYDLFIIFLIISFYINRPYNKQKELTKNIKYFFLINIIGTFILIFLSSGIVPYEYQLSSFFKNFLFQTYIYLYLGYYAFQNLNIQNINRILIYISIICGIYGIFIYTIKINLYVDLLSIIYKGSENIYSYFMEESRGGLEGRISGTMVHPLQWGQFWNILIAYIFLYRKQINIYLWFICMIIGSINIILCGSRSAIVALVIMFIFFLYSYGPKRFIKYSIVTYLIAITTVSIFSPTNNKSNNIVTYIQSALFFWDNSYSEKAGITGSNTNMRANQLTTSINIMLTNPIGGLGYNYQYYTKDNDISTDLLGFESIVFKLLVEQGISGLILFLLSFNLIRRETIKSIQNKTNKRIINGYFYSFLASIIFTGIQGNSWLFFVCLIFIYINNRQQYDSQNYSLLLVKQ